VAARARGALDGTGIATRRPLTGREVLLDLGPIIRRRVFPIGGIGLEGRRGQRQWLPEQNRKFFLPFGKHCHTIPAPCGRVELPPGVDNEDWTLALRAVFAGAIWKVRHVVPLRRADEAEVAGGDHGMRRLRMILI
jgi:hypothetical protein